MKYIHNIPYFGAMLKTINFMKKSKQAIILKCYWRYLSKVRSTLLLETFLRTFLTSSLLTKYLSFH